MALIRLNEYEWEVPIKGDMRVPGKIFASDEIIEAVSAEETFKQVANVATLPGILKASFAMPDIHWGYGFPIGGVAAFDWKEGIVSPGGVGYDINCGVRLSGLGITEGDVRPKLSELVDALFAHIPTGVGGTGHIRLNTKDEKKVLIQGAHWAVKNGYGSESDLERIEDSGKIADADPDQVSERAIERGRDQLGTLGSSNHFLEIGVVDVIYDSQAAAAFGLFEHQVTVMLHSGSRGLGYQVCDDSLFTMTKHVKKIGIELPDKQLSCAYIQSTEGQHYLSAMACAANYAFANRQILMHLAEEVLLDVLHVSPRTLDMHLIYDICHNMAKKETHLFNGEKRMVCVHRKGATRAFPPGHPALCDAYKPFGQPILIPGDMGRASYVLSGASIAMEKTFGSTCHGAGRRLSRTAAMKAGRGRAIQKELGEKGIMVRSRGRSTLSEEMPDAYKDVSKVVDVVHGAGLAKKVARIRPMGVIKG